MKRAFANGAAAVAILLVAAAAGCRKADEGKVPASVSVARVGDREITADDVYRSLYPQGKPDNAKVDGGTARRVVDQLVEREAILAWAAGNNVEVEEADVTARVALIKADYGARGFASYLKSQGLTAESFREVIRDDLIVEAAIEAAVVEEVSVSYDDVVAYYNVHGDEFEGPAEYHIKQIVTDDKAKAEQSLAKLEYGTTFEEVARELSLSPDRHMGGDVGYTTLDALPPEVAAAVEKMRPGETSGIIETRYGFEIVRVVGVRDARRKPLTEVRTEIEDRLRGAREEEVYARWIEGVKKDVKISVDESALSQL